MSIDNGAEQLPGASAPIHADHPKDLKETKAANCRRSIHLAALARQNDDGGADCDDVDAAEGALEKTEPAQEALEPGAASCRPEAQSKLDAKPGHSQNFQIKQHLSRLLLVPINGGEDGQGQTKKDKTEDKDVVGDLATTAGPLQEVVDFGLDLAVANMLARVLGWREFGQILIVAHQRDPKLILSTHRICHARSERDNLGVFNIKGKQCKTILHVKDIRYYCSVTGTVPECCES